MNLLDIEHRPRSGRLRRYREGYQDCTAANDPCLESGCAAQADLSATRLLRAGIEYHGRAPLNGSSCSQILAIALTPGSTEATRSGVTYGVAVTVASVLLVGAGRRPSR